MTVARPPVVVIGVGNPMRGDDGVGPAVVDAIGAVPSGVELAVCDGEAGRLLELWRERELAVVVDAVVSGAGPGTVHLLEDADLANAAAWQAGTSSHAAGVAAALALGAAVERRPERLVLIGVEAGSVAVGENLSATVCGVVPAVVAQVRALVDHRER